jgi:hypothetical protein
MKLFFGNSGRPGICLDNCKLHKAFDKKFQEWILVQFVGIHSGGEFVNCVDCLHVLPYKRKEESPSNLNICHNANRKKTSYVYNYSLILFQWQRVIEV